MTGIAVGSDRGQLEFCKRQLIRLSNAQFGGFWRGSVCVSPNRAVVTVRFGNGIATLMFKSVTHGDVTDYFDGVLVIDFGDGRRIAERRVIEPMLLEHVVDSISVVQPLTVVEEFAGDDGGTVFGG